MKVVYHCYGGAHASPVAASIHLGRLPDNRPLTAREIQSLSLFDRVQPADYGRLVHVGIDAAGHDVFVLGCGKYREVMLKALEGLSEILGGDPNEYLLVDVLPCVNLPMRIGGFVSRMLKLVALGRPLVTWGTLRAVPQLQGLARATAARLGMDGLTRTSPERAGILT